MPVFVVKRNYGGHTAVTRIEAITPGRAIEKAMAADGVTYSVSRDDRPKEVYDLTPNGLQGRGRS